MRLVVFAAIFLPLPCDPGVVFEGVLFFLLPPLALADPAVDKVVVVGRYFLAVPGHKQ